MNPFSNPFSEQIFLQKYSMNGKESWSDTCKRVVDDVCRDHVSNEIKEEIYKLMVARKFIPGGRYLYAAGRQWRNFNNCFLLRAEDSSEGWSQLMRKATAMLMSGGGIGVDYSELREEGATLKRKGGVSSGPLAAMHMVNEVGRFIMQGGSRRAAIWAGLDWKHPDIDKFLTLKNHSAELKALKEKDLTFPVPMELTNISVSYDKDFFEMMENPGAERHHIAKEVWLKNCRQAFETAEPGMSFNYVNENESLRNACTEIVSEDDSDKCNLGTVWMNRHTDKLDFHRTCQYGTIFLLCGGIESDVPLKEVEEVGKRNNRIGLGLGGIHEWLMLRGQPYEVTGDMHDWLYEYVAASEDTAKEWSKRLNVSEPRGKRAIAPTGTLGIIAETTTGIEPLFCKAYLRRYFKEGNWRSQYVVDGTVKSLLKAGVKLESIQDSFDLSFENRVKFQADIQDYVDMGISSTCNMPKWGSDENNETTVEKYADILLKHAKRLRGFTVYPDGCRGGQPLTRVDLDTALKNEGQETVEYANVCDITKGGTCGS